jgi:hypothetical protein
MVNTLLPIGQRQTEMLNVTIKQQLENVMLLCKGLNILDLTYLEKTLRWSQIIQL